MSAYTEISPTDGSESLAAGDHWWRLQPLLDAVDLTATALSGRLGLSGTAVALAATRGLTDRQADEWAIRLGVHPMSVWGWAWVEHADRAAGRPAYVRVAAALRREIEDGVLRPGEQLPGVHALAQRWDVCTLAITTAVDELRADGLIASRRHRGERARVADDVAGAA